MISSYVGLNKSIKVAIMGFVALVCSVIAFILTIESTFAIILDLFVVWILSLLTLTFGIEAVKKHSVNGEVVKKPKPTRVVGLIGVFQAVAALFLLVLNLAIACNAA